MIKIAARANKLEFSPIRKLVPYAVAAKKRGVKIYHLNIGQPDIKSPEMFLKGIRKYKEEVVAYEKSEGSDLLKASLVNYYKGLNLKIEPGQIVVTNGGSEALIMAFFILFEPGDECLTIEPTYTNYLTFAAQAGVLLKPVTTKLSDNFVLPDVNKIKSLISKKTKGILVNNPSNPTGAVYEKKMMEQLSELCLSHNLFMICDEVYREFVYDGKKADPALSFKKAEQSIVMVDSLSKRYSLCGARLGMLVSKNKTVIEAASKLSQARLASPTIEQAAASGLDKLSPKYFQLIKSEYKGRREVLINELSKIPGVKFNQPQGAFYLIAELPVKDAEEFCKFLLEKFSYKKETVMLAPAEGFYLTVGLGRNQVRIAYVLNKQALKKAVELIGRGLEAFKRFA